MNSSFWTPPLPSGNPDMFENWRYIRTMNTFRFTGVALTCHMHRKRLRCLIATGSLSSQCLHRSWYGLLAGLCLLPTWYLDIFGIHGEHLDNSRTQKGCCSCRARSREFFHELMLLLQAWIGPPKWELLLSWLHLLICGITSWPSTGISSQVPLSSVSCCWKLLWHWYRSSNGRCEKGQSLALGKTLQPAHCIISM